MRLAVLSDMHGNDIAFAAVMDDLDRAGFDQIVCLGDAIQGGPQPVEVTRRLRERNIPVVMGNADSWLLTGFKSGAEAISEDRMRKMLAAREWSLGKLSDEDKAFIAGFQPTIRIELGNGEHLLCFHGSPSSYDDLLLPDSPAEIFKDLLSPHRATFFCGGHTHVQFVRHLLDGFHFNPGSAGSAYRHGQPEGELMFDSFAEYAMLSVDGPRIGLEFVRVPFDVEKLASTYQASGRPNCNDALASLKL
jgi:putative phosphoesterase